MDASAWGYMSGAEAVLEGLQRAGLRRLFAEPTASGEIVDAGRRSPVELVMVTRNGASLVMADAQARLTGEPAPCLVGAERGLAGVVPYLATARLDSVPVLVLVALAPGQVVEPDNLVASCSDGFGRQRAACKGVFAVQEPEEVPRLLAQALGLCRSGEPGPVALLSPQGQRLDQPLVERLARLERLILVTGHYEGFDERIRLALADMEISIGDFVLSGGEIPAMAVLDAVVRLLPGALGEPTSTREESFSMGLLEYPQYTRPRDFRGMQVPEVLLSGDHARIAEWRRQQALERTRRRRPDLLEKYLRRQRAEGPEGPRRQPEGEES